MKSQKEAELEKEIKELIRLQLIKSEAELKDIQEGKVQQLADEIEFLKNWIKSNKDKYFRNNAFIEAEKRLAKLHSQEKKE